MLFLFSGDILNQISAYHVDICHHKTVILINIRCASIWYRFIFSLLKRKVMNKVITLIFVLTQLWAVCQEICTIEGKVTDLKGESLLFANVALYQNGVMITGIETDIDGNYFLSDIKPGKYDMEASYVGYTTQKLTGLIVKAKSNRVNFQLSDEAVIMGVEIKAYKVPLIEFDCTTSGSTTGDKLRKLPTKSVHDIAKTSAGDSGREGSDISVRGSRSEETVYFLDGVRVTTADKDSKTSKESDHFGLITAGEWNDLNNWEKWSELLEKDEFKNMNKYWGIQTQHRYPVFATNEDNSPIAGVSVCLKDNKDSIIWNAITDIHGRAEMFDMSESPLKNPILYYQFGNTKNKIALHRKNMKHGTNITIKADCRSTSKVNIAFVVDGTGSMGDEIAFLKSDLASVIENVERRNTNVSISYGSVFYQDIGDTYVTKAHDFTIDESLLISFINDQNSGGGGDFPEAVDSALIHSLNLTWDDDAEVKLVFLLLDAPPHLELIERYKNAVIKAAKMGIKIIPVTASGINRETDFLMKFTSILTNGTYAFITDHSGIGGDHLAPLHDEYEVEKLNELLVRVINGYIYNIPCNQNLVSFKNEEVVIHPNPAKDVIHVVLTDQKFKNVDVVSSTGQLLIRINETDKNKIRINIQDLISGQYFVRITYENKVITKSFIKMN